MKAIEIKQSLHIVGSKTKAQNSARFFKTAPGQYGYGDIFIGVTMPEQRNLARQYVELSFDEVEKLVASQIHEHRMTGLLILVYKFERETLVERKNIYNFYMSHLDSVNNWDLVDVTCDKIVGSYLFDKNRSVLYDLLTSSVLWERRIAVVSTLYFIKHNDFDDTLRICSLLLDDSEDLMHKACGWMLREVGKRNEALLCSFLDKHVHRMPRTMLRYAIERFAEKKRQYYLRL